MQLQWSKGRRVAAVGRKSGWEVGSGRCGCHLPGREARLKKQEGRGRVGREEEGKGPKKGDRVRMMAIGLRWAIGGWRAWVEG